LKRVNKLLSYILYKILIFIGIQLPSYECSKEKISLFEPSSLVIYLLNNTVTYKVWQLLEFETSKLKPLVKANIGNAQVYEQIASQLEELVAKHDSEESLKVCW
jgi:hypothetical protein